MKRTRLFSSIILLFSVIFMVFLAGCESTGPTDPANHGAQQTLSADNESLANGRGKGPAEDEGLIGGNGDPNMEFFYEDSTLIKYFAPQDIYRGGEIVLPNNTQWELNQGALTPPEEIPWGEDVLVTMQCFKLIDKEEIEFVFGPHGCKFDPQAKVILNYEALNIDVPVFYYIDENGNYIEQIPDYVDLQGKWMRVFLDHFSRYAIAGN